MTEEEIFDAQDLLLDTLIINKVPPTAGLLACINIIVDSLENKGATKSMIDHIYISLKICIETLHPELNIDDYRMTYKY